jgi:hypothetical protein
MIPVYPNHNGIMFVWNMLHSYDAQNDGFIMFSLKLMMQRFAFYKLELKVAALTNAESLFRTELVFQS